MNPNENFSLSCFGTVLLELQGLRLGTNFTSFVISSRNVFETIGSLMWFVFLQVGFTKEGKILALDLDMFNNGGSSLDLSGSVLERAMFHSDNVYRIPDMRVRGRVCFSNLSSNTAFRGFGGPQGMLIVESWIDRIASEVGRRPEEIRVRLQPQSCSLF